MAFLKRSTTYMGSDLLLLLWDSLFDDFNLSHIIFVSFSPLPVFLSELGKIQRCCSISQYRFYYVREVVFWQKVIKTF